MAINPKSMLQQGLYEGVPMQNVADGGLMSGWDYGGVPMQNVADGGLMSRWDTEGFSRPPLNLEETEEWEELLRRLQQKPSLPPVEAQKPTEDVRVGDTGEGPVTQGLGDMETDPFYDNEYKREQRRAEREAELEKNIKAAGEMSNGGRNTVTDRFGNRVSPDGTVTGRKGRGRPGYGTPANSSPGGGGSGGSGSGGSGSGGSGYRPPQFSGGPGGGQSGGLRGDLDSGIFRGQPVFPDGQGLQTPSLPTLGGPTGTTDPNELGGPIQSPEQSSEVFDRLLDSFDDANTQANQANEDRYGDILEGYLAQLTGANRTLDETSGGLGNAEGIMAGRWNRVGSALEAGEGNLERRFGETQGRLSNSEDALQGILSGLGGQQRDDINDRYDRQSGNLEQDLISRGLGNTTVRSNMLSGNETRRGDELGRLSESLGRERVGQGNQAINRGLGLDTFGLGQAENAIGRRSQYGVQGQQFGENTINRMLGEDQNRLAVPANLSTNMLGFMERRTDEGPDMNMLTNLALQFGSFGSGDTRPRNIGNQYSTQPIPIQ